MLLSPVLFVSFFYVGALLGLLVQEVSLHTSMQASPTFNRVSFGVFVALVFIGPAWGILRAAWLLAHNRRKAESLGALLLSIPLLFVAVGAAQRAMAVQGASLAVLGTRHSFSNAA